jgi:hypothetical protein
MMRVARGRRFARAPTSGRRCNQRPRNEFALHSLSIRATLATKQLSSRCLDLPANTTQLTAECICLSHHPKEVGFSADERPVRKPSPVDVLHDLLEALMTFLINSPHEVDNATRTAMKLAGLVA